MSSEKQSDVRDASDKTKPVHVEEEEEEEEDLNEDMILIDEDEFNFGESLLNESESAADTKNGNSSTADADPDLGKVLEDDDAYEKRKRQFLQEPKPASASAGVETPPDLAELEQAIGALDSDGVLKCRAKLVRIRRSPVTWKRGHPTRVTSAEACILDGLLKDRTTTVNISCLTIWGHPAAKADFSYVLKRFDPVTLMVKATFAHGKMFVTAQTATIGGITNAPVDINDEAKHSFPFKQWLKNRNVTFDTFKSWIGGTLPIKLFFPYPAALSKGVLISFVHDPDATDITNVSDRPVIGGCVRIIEEGEHQAKVAYFDRDDFFAYGVRTLHFDLKFFLKPGDMVKCQVEVLSNSERKRLARELKAADPEVSLSTSLCMIGETFPGNKGEMTSTQSPELRSFLDKKGMLILQFDRQRLNPSAQALEREKKKDLPFAPTGANRLQIANALTGKAMLTTSMSDPKIGQMLDTTEDFEVAVFISKVFTQALITKMQGELRDKIKSKFGGGLSLSLQNQMNQVRAAERHVQQKHAAGTELDIKAQAQSYSTQFGTMKTTAAAAATTAAGQAQDYETWLKEQQRVKKEAEERNRVSASAAAAAAIKEAQARSRKMPLPKPVEAQPEEPEPELEEFKPRFDEKAKRSRFDQQRAATGEMNAPPASASSFAQALPRPEVQTVGQDLSAYPNAVEAAVRQYAHMKNTYNLPPVQKPMWNKNKLINPQRMPMTLPTPVESTSAGIAQKLKEVEENLKQKAEDERIRAEAAAAEKKKELTAQRMKSVLQSYRGSVTRKATVPEPKVEERKPAPAASNEKTLSPLEMLRDCTINRKLVSVEDDLMWLGGNAAFPKKAKTNFKATPKFDSDIEFYTLETLHYFLQNQSKDHGQYIRGALLDNIPVVRKPDRDSLTAYLTGQASWVANITGDSYKDLNPHLLAATAVRAATTTASRSRSPSRRATRSPSGRRSPSPSSRRRTRSPPRRGTRSPSRRSTRSPPRRQTRSPDRRRSSPRRRPAERSRSPGDRRSRERRTRSPDARRPAQVNPWLEPAAASKLGGDSYNPFEPTSSPPREREPTWGSRTEPSGYSTSRDPWTSSGRSALDAYSSSSEYGSGRMDVAKFSYDHASAGRENVGYGAVDNEYGGGGGGGTSGLIDHEKYRSGWDAPANGSGSAKSEPTAPPPPQIMGFSSSFSFE